MHDPSRVEDWSVLGEVILHADWQYGTYGRHIVVYQYKKSFRYVYAEERFWPEAYAKGACLVYTTRKSYDSVPIEIKGAKRPTTPRVGHTVWYGSKTGSITDIEKEDGQVTNIYVEWYNGSWNEFELYEFRGAWEDTVTGGGWRLR